LNTRISEYQNQINRKSSNTIVITEHKLRHNHDFDWLNVKILNSKKFFEKELFLKCSIYNAQLQNNGLNYQTDTEYIQHTSILNRL